jgi:transketolase
MKKSIIINNNVRESFADTIYDVGKKDKKLCVIVSDISHYRLQKFANENPSRYYNLGVCENSILNVAAGIAHAGFIPVVHTFASFLIDKSYEQLKLSFGYNKLPVNLVVIGSGIEYSYHGVTHHSYVDSVLVKSIENSCVYNPGSFFEFDKIFKQTYNNGKINLYRATTKPHNISYNDFPKLKYIAKNNAIVIKKGKDLTIIVTGYHLNVAVNSIEKFKKNNVDIEILYVPTLKPLDHKSIFLSLKKTKKFIIMEHQSQYGGLFSDICSLLLSNKDYSGIIGKNISFGDRFIHEYGTFDQHNHRLNFSVQGLFNKYKEF